MNYEDESGWTVDLPSPDLISLDTSHIHTGIETLFYPPLRVDDAIQRPHEIIGARKHRIDDKDPPLASTK